MAKTKRNDTIALANSPSEPLTKIRMNAPHDLSYRTDFIFHRPNGIVEEHADYWVVRTPNNPTFWFGNFILFKRAPKATDLKPWLKTHRNAFGEFLKHHIFGWDEPREGDISAFLEDGFQTSHGISLMMNEYSTPVPINPSITVRPIQTDEDWEAVLHEQELVDNIDFSYPDDNGVFRRKQMMAYQKLIEAGRGHWWGAFEHENLVGDMGLFFDETNEVGRFQNVSTHPAHRRKRICTTLLDHIVRHAFETVGAKQLVIATGAEEDNPAIPTYKNFGFQLAAPNYALKRV